MPLESLLEDSARRVPDKTALVCGDIRLSYGELDATADRVAVGLTTLGVAPGDRVAVCLENSVECVAAIFGILKAGCVLLLVNSSTKAEKLGSILDDAEARALFLADRKLASVAGALVGRSHLRALAVVGDPPAEATESLRVTSWTALALGGRVRAPAKQHDDDDLAVLLYTSGSTGKPKGVMHTHHGLHSATKSIVTYLELGASDIVLQVLPLSFGYGLTQLLTTFLVGGTLVLERSFAYPQLTVARLAKERATTFAMVPTIATVLTQMDLSTCDLSSLRTLTNAGAGLAPHIARALLEKLPHVRLFPMYGQTECIRATYLPPDEVLQRPTSVGRGMPNQHHWLADEAGARLPPGSTGELVVAGAHVMQGYWKMPDETARKIRPGPGPNERTLFTGDLFHMDADGWLTFVARKDDIIKTRGEKVSPKEVEDALYALEGVVEAAVIGVPDPLLGEMVKAFVVARPGSVVDERSIMRHCAARLEDFAVPKAVALLPELPKSPNGKIDKQALKDATGSTASTGARDAQNVKSSTTN